MSISGYETEENYVILMYDNSDSRDVVERFPHEGDISGFVAQLQPGERLVVLCVFGLQIHKN